MRKWCNRSTHPFFYVKSRLNSRTRCVFSRKSIDKNKLLFKMISWSSNNFFFSFEKFNTISSDLVLCFFKTENVSQMERLLKVSFRVVISLQLTRTFVCVIDRLLLLYHSSVGNECEWVRAEQCYMGKLDVSYRNMVGLSMANHVFSILKISSLSTIQFTYRYFLCVWFMSYFT